MTDIMILEKPNGTFILFTQYDSEDDFEKFVEQVSVGLSASTTKPRVHPYSLSADIQTPLGEVTAIFQDYAGCCLRIEKENTSLREWIVSIFQVKI